MQKLMAELGRLYLSKQQQYHEAAPDGGRLSPAGALSAAILERHLRGEQTVAVDLVDGDGGTRALLIEFGGAAGSAGSPHWDKVCEVARVLQTELGLPAPAVSISGGNAYGLWLSLETAVPAARAREFLRLLRLACFPDIDEAEIGLHPGGAEDGAIDLSPVQLPPCLHRATGRWAAFINPGMGAAFADEPGLEMPPPAAAQAAFLDGLHSIGITQFEQSLAALEKSHGSSAPDGVPAPEPAPAPMPMPKRPSRAGDLLLRDATLEDIVRHLHEKNIEPTFRHLIAK